MRERQERHLPTGGLRPLAGYHTELHATMMDVVLDSLPKKSPSHQERPDLLAQEAAEMLVTPRRKAGVQGISFIRGIRDFPDGCHRQTGMLQTDDLNDRPIIIRGVSDSLEQRYHLGFMK